MIAEFYFLQGELVLGRHDDVLNHWGEIELLVQWRNEYCAGLVVCLYRLKLDAGKQTARHISTQSPAVQACSLCSALRQGAASRSEHSLNFGEEKTNTDRKHLTSAISIILSLLFFKCAKFQ
jgi:hypothetical protein